jgi:hypothetical protein
VRVWPRHILQLAVDLQHQAPITTSPIQSIVAVVFSRSFIDGHQCHSLGIHPPTLSFWQSLQSITYSPQRRIHSYPQTWLQFASPPQALTSYTDSSASLPTYGPAYRRRPRRHIRLSVRPLQERLHAPKRLRLTPLLLRTHPCAAPDRYEEAYCRSASC